MVEQPQAHLMVLLFTDIVGSVDYKKRFGNPVFQQLVSRHDDLFRAIVDALPGGEILKDTGDGFFARFATASDAVKGALLFQHALSTGRWDPEPLRVRIGLHIGEVAELALDVTGKPKIVGLAADVAARIMGLALPGQTLMTRTAFDDSRQYLRGHPLVGNEPGPPLRWMAHGSYLFKGNDEPLEVFEVGGLGIAPLKPPPDGEKARRVVGADEEATLGWRPATGLEVHGRKGWALERKLGEGAFGEVWVAEHRKTKGKRVFKFCFDADRVKSFKRELTLFRIIRETLGERRDIARLYEIQLEKAPFYLESEYVESGDLAVWVERQGGLGNVPLSTRLAIVAETAGAAAAAHSVGILHKDIKPGNILMYLADDGSPRPRLADFGIGVLTDRSQLAARNITMAGFTETELLTPGSSLAGTRMYTPPESLVGKPFTIQGDVYALGVLLYQMAVGDFAQPLGTGWERDIADEVLRGDISACVDHDPDRRLRSAAELTQRLTDLEGRRTRRRRQARRRALVRVASVLSAFLAVAAVALTVHTGRVTRERDRANQEAETALAVSEFLVELFAVSDPGEGRGNTITAREILDEGAAKITDEMIDQPRVRARLMATMGRVYMKLGLYDAARPLLEEAPKISHQALGEDHPEVAMSLARLAILHRETGDYQAARPVFERALAIDEKVLGPDHPDVAEILNNLALTLARQADYDGARPRFERALEIREKAFGTEHPKLAESLNNLGLLLWRAGDYEESLPRFERALGIQEKVLGPDHPDVAMTLSNLGAVMLQMGNPEGAQPLLVRALDIDEKAYGPDHPHVAIDLTSLAVLLKEAGHYDEAQPLYERALQIDEKALGADHPDVAVDLNNLADLLWHTGDHVRARTLFERALAIDENALGPDHPDVGIDLNGLGMLLKDMGDHKSAYLHFERALGILEQGLGSDHLEVAVSLNGLASVLKETGDYDRARSMYARALAIREEAFGPDDPRIAETLSEFADLLRRKNEAEKAAELEQRAREIRGTKAAGNDTGGR